MKTIIKHISHADLYDIVITVLEFADSEELGRIADAVLSEKVNYLGETDFELVSTEED
jgi:hypothetical protein